MKGDAMEQQIYFAEKALKLAGDDTREQFAEVRKVAGCDLTPRPAPSEQPRSTVVEGT